MCGIIGIASNGAEIRRDLYLGVWAQMNRGQESAGMVTFDGKYHIAKGMGTPDIVFGGNVLETLIGTHGIGHARYSTTGESSENNIQPIEGSFGSVPFWISHNGNLVRYQKVREECKDRGYFFKTTTDTEVIAALIFYSQSNTIEDAVIEALKRVEGTYSLVIIYKNKILGIRDPSGNRPLIIGRGRGIHVLASESAVCDVLGISYLRDVKPGELVILPNNDSSIIESATLLPNATQKNCIFEFVYFLRPDSIFNGRRCHIARSKMGEILWNEHPVKVDIIVPVPDSGYAAAIGFARASGIDLEPALFRFHGVGRSFMEPVQALRDDNIHIKLNVIPELVRGRIIALIDDSIVRGTVTRKVVKMLLAAGAREVHIRVASPLYMHPCFYGIDTYRVRNELIAMRYNGDTEAIRQEIGATSLAYLSLAGLKRAIIESGENNLTEENFCDACFTGKYHIPIED